MLRGIAGSTAFSLGYILSPLRGCIPSLIHPAGKDSTINNQHFAGDEACSIGSQEDCSAG